MYRFQLVGPTGNLADLIKVLQGIPGTRVRHEGERNGAAVVTVVTDDLAAIDSLYGWWKEARAASLVFITDRGRWAVRLSDHTPESVKTIVEEDRHMLSTHLPHYGEA
jgi:hypothetical protein